MVATIARLIRGPRNRQLLALILSSGKVELGRALTEDRRATIVAPVLKRGGLLNPAVDEIAPRGHLSD